MKKVIAIALREYYAVVRSKAFLLSIILLPVLMVGDYNYPVFKENLSQKVREHGYELNLSDSRTYTRYRFFRGHYDFATSVGLTIDRVRTLPQGRSDHLPILVTATVTASASAKADAA